MSKSQAKVKQQRRMRGFAGKPKTTGTLIWSSSTRGTYRREEHNFHGVLENNGRK